MVNTCYLCDKLINEGDKVTVNVTSTYHMLKSTVAYALDKAEMVADAATLAHEECCYLEDSK